MGPRRAGAARAPHRRVSAVRFSDFLRTTTLMSAAAASVLAAVTLAGATGTSDDLVRSVGRRLVGDGRRDRPVAGPPRRRPRRRSPRCWPAPGRRPRCPRSIRPARCSTACGRCCSRRWGPPASAPAAPGPGDRRRLRDHLGAGLAAPGLGGDRDRGARRRALLRRAHLAAAADQARAHAGLPLQPARAQRRFGLAPGPTPGVDGRGRAAPTCSWSRSAAPPGGGRPPRELSDALAARRARGRTGHHRPDAAVRTFMLTDYVQARSARAAAARGRSPSYDPRAVVYCSMTAALLWPRPGRDLARLARGREPPRAPRGLAAAGGAPPAGPGAADPDHGRSVARLRCAPARTPDTGRRAGGGGAVRRAGRRHARHRRAGLHR